MSDTQWDISFEDLCFSVSGWINDKKEILRNVSGGFRSCELSVILGQSGSGKTTLLNILSGYEKKNVSGTIRVNGEAINSCDRKKSKYITQNYALHRLITVQEAMNFAANFKMNGASSSDKIYKVHKILERLGLSQKLNLYAGKLSGGEQKRLSIAMELVDDPSILYIDEPTTGLDSSSSVQCIQLLKKLTQEGKTIVCTIHTPSPLLLGMFDHLYALADGSCIYQGSSKNLVPFLSDLDLECPETFTPSDFLLEIANGDYGEQNFRLTERIQNGRSSCRDLIDRKPSFCTTNVQTCGDSSPQFTNELQQLLIRNFLMTKRDSTLCQMRFAIHFLIAACIGCIYNDIGQDASNIFNIYKLLFFNIFVLMFTAFSSLQTSFPLNLPIIRREHFNRWYSTTAYYLALTISDIPLIISTNLIYIVITYFMTNQPLELYRFCAYYLVLVLLSVAAQGLGLIAGSLMNVKFTLILGSFFICPFVLFSNFFIHVKDTAPVWHWIFETSFIKHALEGSMQAIFGFSRDKMDCDVGYCHYRWPSKFMDSVGITDSYSNVVFKLVTFAFIFRIIAFIIIWLRLKH